MGVFTKVRREGFEVYDFSTPIGWIDTLRFQSTSIGFRIPRKVCPTHFTSRRTNKNGTLVGCSVLYSCAGLEEVRTSCVFQVNEKQLQWWDTKLCSASCSWELNRLIFSKALLDTIQKICRVSFTIGNPGVVSHLIPILYHVDTEPPNHEQVFMQTKPITCLSLAPLI